jgi:hypothetical protein
MKHSISRASDMDSEEGRRRPWRAIGLGVTGSAFLIGLAAILRALMEEATWLLIVLSLIGWASIIWLVYAFWRIAKLNLWLSVFLGVITWSFLIVLAHILRPLIQ